MAKLLMINENTVIKLYEGLVCTGAEQHEICTMVVDEILAKLTKTDKPHPLKELFLDQDDRGPFYEMVHFVFSTIDTYAKSKATFKKP